MRSRCHTCKQVRPPIVQTAYCVGLLPRGQHLIAELNCLVERLAAGAMERIGAYLGSRLVNLRWVFKFDYDPALVGHRSLRRKVNSVDPPQRLHNRQGTTERVIVMHWYVPAFLVGLHFRCGRPHLPQAPIPAFVVEGSQFLGLLPIAVSEIVERGVKISLDRRVRNVQLARDLADAVTADVENHSLLATRLHALTTFRSSVDAAVHNPRAFKLLMTKPLGRIITWSGYLTAAGPAAAAQEQEG